MTRRGGNDLDVFLERTLYARVARVRPYVLLRGTLLLLAFDMWLTRASHGGRYGAGGFNVAHFAIVDRLQPMPTPAIGVGVCILVGLLALLAAHASKPPRWLIGLIFALHTWSWAMSMLDSYQHHYLLSIVLLALMFFEPTDADDALTESSDDGAGAVGPYRDGPSREPPAPRASLWDVLRATVPRRSSWPYALFCWSVAVVYTFTALSKMDPQWRSGDALKRVLGLSISGEPAAGAFDPIGPARRIAELLDLDPDTFWWGMGYGVMGVQLICAAGYALAPFRDVVRNRWVRGFYPIALLTALSFHFGAEYMSLEIGWFSWFMVGYAFIAFLPASWWVVALRVTLPLKDAVYQRLDLWAARGGLLVILLSIAASSMYWTELAPFDVPLSRLFGEGMNTPMLLMWVVLVIAVGLRAVRTITVSPDAALWVGGVGAAMGAMAVVAVGIAADLPGSVAAAIIACIVGAAAIALAVYRGDPRAGLNYAMSAGLVAVLFIGANRELGGALGLLPQRRRRPPTATRVSRGLRRVRESERVRPRGTRPTRAPRRNAARA